MNHLFWQGKLLNKETHNSRLAIFIRLVYAYQWVERYGFYNPKDDFQLIDPRYKLKDGSW